MTRALRIVLGLALLGGVLWLLGARAAFAATYYVGCGTVAGCSASDSNAGTSPTAPWRTYGKVIMEGNKTAAGQGTLVGPGDTVKFRTGRYATCEGPSGLPPNNWFYNDRIKLRGTAGAKITFTIDDAGGAGDVELHGGARPGVCRSSGWNVARKCDASVGVPTALVDAVCASDADCGSVANSCDTVPNVYWKESVPDGVWAGNSAGVAYQPNLNPIGGPPKIFEILYSASVGNVPIKMPTWTAGHDQVWPYATWGAGQRVDLGSGNFTGFACRADRTPWFCCTGNGSGPTCNNGVPPRIYVQTASGADPGTVGDANFGPVEFPFVEFPLQFGHMDEAATAAANHLTFTNNANGRRFRLWWSTRGPIWFQNVENLLLEDVDVAYSSRTLPQAHLTETDSANASGFPRYNQGDTYLVTGSFDQGALDHVVRFITWRRAKIHGTQGNEAFHMIGASPGALERFTDHLLEDVVHCDSPYALAPGEHQTDCTPNANSNQVTKSWPPPGYAAWNIPFNTDGGAVGGFWGPLGGGPNTDGAMISTARNQTFRGNVFRDTGLISFKESGGSGGLLFERNIVDLRRMYYADAGLHPNVLSTYCGSANGCGGLEGRLSLGIPMRFRASNQRGAIIRNNLFLNVQGWAIVGNCFSNDSGDTECATLNLPDPAYPPQIVNNTFHIVGDYRAALQRFCRTGGGTWRHDTPCTANADCGADTCQYRNFPLFVIDLIGSRPGRNFTWAAGGASKAIIKNNLFFRESPSVATPADPSGTAAERTPMFRITSDLAAVTDFDRNLWADPTGMSNLTWAITVPGGSTTTYATFNAWRTAIQAFGATNETSSLFVDGATPLFKAPYTDLSPDTTAPGISAAYQTGLDLSAVGVPAFDLENTPRPAGQWSIGAFQAEMTGSTVTTTTTTSSVSSSSSSSSSTSSSTSSTTSSTVATGATYYIDKDGLGPTGVPGSAPCSDGYTYLQAQNPATPWCRLGRAVSTSYDWIANAGVDGKVCVTNGTQGAACSSDADCACYGGNWRLAPGDTIRVRRGTYSATFCLGGGSFCSLLEPVAALDKGTAAAPITLAAYPGDERLVIFDPQGTMPPELYWGVAFRDTATDGAVCWGGSNPGAACTTNQQCTGGTCDEPGWYWVIDGIRFTNWDYVYGYPNASYNINDPAYPRSNPFVIPPGCGGNCPGYAGSHSAILSAQGSTGKVTIRNCEFDNNEGGGVLNLRTAWGFTIEDNLIHDNWTKGWTSPVNVINPKGWRVQEPTIIRRNKIWNNRDTPPVWALDGNFDPSAAPWRTGAYCTDPDGDANPADDNECNDTVNGGGYLCPCKVGGDCESGTCTPNPNAFDNADNDTGADEGDTEGNGIIIDRGSGTCTTNPRTSCSWWGFEGCANAMCTAAGTPYAGCSDYGTGSYSTASVGALCTGPGTPFDRCLSAGVMQYNSAPGDRICNMGDDAYVQIENNLVWDNWGFGINAFFSGNITVRNNTTWNNGKRHRGDYSSEYSLWGINSTLSNNIGIPRAEGQCSCTSDADCGVGAKCDNSLVWGTVCRNKARSRCTANSDCAAGRVCQFKVGMQALMGGGYYPQATLATQMFTGNLFWNGSATNQDIIRLQTPGTARYTAASLKASSPAIAYGWAGNGSSKDFLFADPIVVGPTAGASANLHPTTGSPALAAGDGSTTLWGVLVRALKDFLGYDRSATAPSIGAYEFASGETPPTTPPPTTPPPTTPPPTIAGAYNQLRAGTALRGATLR
jgi:hypothetical protein